MENHERTRRTFSAEQKVSILREHLVERATVSDLCDKHRIQPTLFYLWQKAFFENGAAAFESKRPRSQAVSKEQHRIAGLERKLQERTEALAELMADHVRFKKSLGEI